MTTTHTLREFSLDDVGRVAVIEALTSPEPWSVALFRGEFEVSAAARHWLVAEVGGELVGFGGMMFTGEEGHLMNLGVHPDHRRKGIARHLCAELFLDAQDRGVSALTLEVRAGNTAAVELYRGFGFAPVGSRSGYYKNEDGSREDALILWLHDLAQCNLEGAS